MPAELRALVYWVLLVSSVHWPSKIGLQNVLILWLFITCIAISATIARRSSSFLSHVDRAFMFAGWLSTSFYGLSVAVKGLGADVIIGPRAYALVALPILGWGLARIRFVGDQYILVSAILAMLLLGLSRGAFAAACFMVALTWFKFSDIKSWIRTIILVVVMSFAFVLVLQNVSAFRDRFQQGDIAQIHGISINTEGRGRLWQVIWDDYKSRLGLDAVPEVRTISRLERLSLSEESEPAIRTTTIYE